MSAPLSDQEAEALLQELLRQVMEADGATPAGREALRIALAGLYGALVHLDRATGQPAPSPPKRR